MPAQLVADAVAMRSYAGSQARDLGDQRISIQVHKVFVHGHLRQMKYDPPLVDYPGGGSTRQWPRSLDGALNTSRADVEKELR
jgi:hypothetical protein